MSITSTQGIAHAAILDLPPEIFELVALQLPPEDLPSLRITCRDAASKAHRAFKRAHFQNPCFLLCDEQSLTTLEEISRHPVYARAVKQLWFGGFYHPPRTHNGIRISSELMAHRNKLWKENRDSSTITTTLICYAAFSTTSNKQGMYLIFVW
jgi:hypothetical protein